MKIRALDLIAFGPFTQKTLQFGEDQSGMTVIFGANEAGKSSALRAIRYGLYGIPSQTKDNFLHRNQDLRIGFELLDHTGNVDNFVRRKGTKDTLLSEQGEPISDARLEEICHGIPEGLFSSLFGITHQDLTQGGEDILNQQGELGQALFSASSARKNLHVTLKNLDDMANNLFTPRGKKQAINAGLKKQKELESKLLEFSLSSNDWASLTESYENTAKQADKLSLEIQESDRRVIELERYERLLPKVATRAQLQNKIAEFGDVKLLDKSFTSRRQSVSTNLISAISIEKSLQSRSVSLQEQMVREAMDDSLLAHESTIQSLYQSLESYTRANKELPLLTQQYQTVEAELSSRLQIIEPGLTLKNIDKLQPVLGREADINSAVARYQALTLERKQFSAAVLSAKQQLEVSSQKEVASIDEELLLRVRQQYQSAQQHTGLEAELQSVTTDITSIESRVKMAIAALPFWSGELKELMSLPVPGKETVQGFAKQFEDVASERVQLNSDIKRLSTELGHLRNQMDVLKEGGELPSKQELEEVRSSRNNAWSLLKDQWLDGADVTLEAGFLDSQRKLPEAFEWRMGRADEIADRLRSDSDRVAQLDSISTDYKRREQQKKANEASLQNVEAAHSSIMQEWSGVWEPCAIEPRSPDEMLEWRLDRTEIERLAEELSTHRNKEQSLQATKADLMSALLVDRTDLNVDKSSSLTNVIAAVGVWVETTQKAAQLFERFQQTSERLSDEYSQASNKLAFVDKSMLEWREAWEKIIVGSGLASSSEPDTARDRLQQIRSVFALQKELRSLDAGISQQRHEIDQFEELHKQLSIDPGILPLPQHVSVVYRDFNIQKQAEAVVKKNNEELEKLTADLEKAKQEREASALLMASLLAEAACDSEDLLPDLESRSDELIKIKAQLSTIENDILQDGGGRTLGEIEQAVKSLDAATLSAEINQIKQRVSSELEPNRQQLLEEKGSKDRELKSIDNSEMVSKIAVEIEDTLAQLRNHVAHYMQLKTAAKLLRDEIERFRQQNQGPLLEIAGKYFSELTLGAYVGLGSDFNEQDKVILAAERKNGDKVLVEQMSNGTRDQLYLALRLAAFERSIEQRGPMPFIVDDILIEFDDDRSLAALNIFSRLAKKAQIILFSHHPRIRELSEGLSDAPAIISL